MKLEYTLTPDDAIAMTRYHKQLLGPQKHPTTATNIILTVLFIGGFCLLLLMDQIRANRWQVVLILASAFAGFGLLYWTLSRSASAIPENRLRRMLESREGERALGQRKTELTKNGFVLTTEEEEKTIEWSEVLHVGVTESHVFVYVADGSVLIIPSHAFHNDYQHEEFLEKIREYHQPDPQPEV